MYRITLFQYINLLSCCKIAGNQNPKKAGKGLVYKSMKTGNTNHHLMEVVFMKKKFYILPLLVVIVIIVVMILALLVVISI